MSDDEKSAGEAEAVDVNSRGYRERVFEIVRRIPSGRVMTYGQLAEILGEGYTARTVGFVMHAADEERDPWHRVINAQGACSTGRVIVPPDLQQRMLTSEGVELVDVLARLEDVEVKQPDRHAHAWLSRKECPAVQRPGQARCDEDSATAVFCVIIQVPPARDPSSWLTC